MKNGMWKRSLRRGAALVLALVMSLTITSCSASQGSLTAREGPGNRNMSAKRAERSMKPFPIPGGHTSTMTRLPWNRPWLI